MTVQALKKIINDSIEIFESENKCYIKDLHYTWNPSISPSTEFKITVE